MQGETSCDQIEGKAGGMNGLRKIETKWSRLLARTAWTTPLTEGTAMAVACPSCRAGFVSAAAAV